MKLRLVSSALLSIAFLQADTPAAATTAAPKGDYVLLDQSGDFSILGILTLDGAGNVTGTEVYSSLRSVSDSMTATVTGTYVMTSAKSGTLSLQALDQSGVNLVPLAQNYNFLLASSGDLRSVRTDNGVFSVSTIMPAVVAPAGAATLAMSELDRSNSSLLAQVAVDPNGVASGTVNSFSFSGNVAATLSGTYSAPAKGMGTLTLNMYDSAADQTTTQTFRTASTRTGIVAIRTDPGSAAIAYLEVQ